MLRLLQQQHVRSDPISSNTTGASSSLPTRHFPEPIALHCGGSMDQHCHSAYSHLHLLAPHSFPASYSTGKFIPILLALNLTLSSSLMPMPGLYRSISAMYVRCASAYCANCSACWICEVVFRAEGCTTVSRRRCWMVDGADSFWCVVREGMALLGRGSSRRRRR
jgi:hypothetical protein